jgi:hypothetical protein
MIKIEDINRGYKSTKNVSIYHCFEELIREINLIKIQSHNNSIDTHEQWTNIINDQNVFRDMLWKWLQFEGEINDLIDVILTQRNDKDTDIETSIHKIYVCLSKMIETISPYNYRFLTEVIKKLEKKVEIDARNLKLEENDPELSLKFESSK